MSRKYAMGYGMSVVLMTCCFGAVSASEYYVATNGIDEGPGNKGNPFKTIQFAADKMREGDVCYVRAGTYRETVVIRRSGHEGEQIRFVAMPGEHVVIDGRDPVNSKWVQYKKNIFYTEYPDDVRQVFLNNEMMVEARWPNARPEQLLDRTVWARAKAGSKYGKIVDTELENIKHELTGVDVVLNGAHQFYTWRRAVQQDPGNPSALLYSKDLRGIADHANKDNKWEDDYYYVVGGLGLLDFPLEYFYDTHQKRLYVFRPEGVNLDAVEVLSKNREFGFVVRGKSNISIENFSFFATTVALIDCQKCALSNIRFIYPTFTGDPEANNSTEISGADNKIENVYLGYASGGGITISGANNRIENAIIENTSWYGSLRQPAVSIYGGKGPFGSVLRRATIRHGGSVLVKFLGGPHLIELNDIYDGGKLSKDVALVYTNRPEAAGSVVQFNWVHDIKPEKNEGICIRGDDQTRGLAIRNNVVWGCGKAGIIIKGDNNSVYNNTLLSFRDESMRSGYIYVATTPEERKPWIKQAPLLSRQNVHSHIFNNIATKILSNRNNDTLASDIAVCGNYLGEHADEMYLNPATFVPTQNSPLVDSGCRLPGAEGSYVGKSPDIGAYEYGEVPWIPGASNLNSNRSLDAR